MRNLDYSFSFNSDGFTYLMDGVTKSIKAFKEALMKCLLASGINEAMQRSLKQGVVNTVGATTYIGTNPIYVEHPKGSGSFHKVAKGIPFVKAWFEVRDE